MIIDLTQSELLKQIELKTFFFDPINVAKALILAKQILPGWYYEEIKKELISLNSTHVSKTHLTIPLNQGVIFV